MILGWTTCLTYQTEDGLAWPAKNPKLKLQVDQQAVYDSI
jgi:hypothetical protein